MHRYAWNVKKWSSKEKWLLTSKKEIFILNRERKEIIDIDWY